MGSKFYEDAGLVSSRGLTDQVNVRELESGAGAAATVTGLVDVRC